MVLLLIPLYDYSLYEKACDCPMEPLFIKYEFPFYLN